MFYSLFLISCLFYIGIWLNGLFKIDVKLKYCFKEKKSRICDNYGICVVCIGFVVVVCVPKVMGFCKLILLDRSRIQRVFFLSVTRHKVDFLFVLTHLVHCGFGLPIQLGFAIQKSPNVLHAFIDCCFHNDLKCSHGNKTLGKCVGVRYLLSRHALLISLQFKCYNLIIT